MNRGGWGGGGFGSEKWNPSTVPPKRVLFHILLYHLFFYYYFFFQLLAVVSSIFINFALEIFFNLLEFFSKDFEEAFPCGSSQISIAFKVNYLLIIYGHHSLLGQTDGQIEHF